MISTTVSPSFSGGNLLAQASINISEPNASGPTDVSCVFEDNGVPFGDYEDVELQANSGTFPSDDATLSLVAGLPNAGISQTITVDCSADLGKPTASYAGVNVVVTP